MNRAIPAATNPPITNDPEILNVEALDAFVDLVLELEVVADPDALDEPDEPDELDDPLLVVEPEVPLETAFPGRLTVCFAARDWKVARERVEFALVLLFCQSCTYF